MAPPQHLIEPEIGQRNALRVSYSSNPIIGTSKKGSQGRRPSLQIIVKTKKIPSRKT